MRRAFLLGLALFTLVGCATTRTVTITTRPPDATNLEDVHEIGPEAQAERDLDAVEREVVHAEAEVERSAPEKRRAVDVHRVGCDGERPARTQVRVGQVDGEGGVRVAQEVLEGAIGIHVPLLYRVGVGVGGCRSRRRD